MSQSPKRAFGSSAKNKRKEVTLDLATARSMLPLIRSIVGSLVESTVQLNKLQPEQDNLERHRRELVWQERERRYQISQEITAAAQSQKEAMTELNQLGIEVLDDNQGRIGFPTKINGKPAVFSWQPGEDNVQYWSYEDEEVRRPIPPDWLPMNMSKGK